MKEIDRPHNSIHHGILHVYQPERVLYKPKLSLFEALSFENSSQKISFQAQPVLLERFRRMNQVQLDPQTISIMIAATSVVVGVIFSITSIFMSARNAARSRQATIFMKFHEVVSAKDFLEEFQQVVGVWQWPDAKDYMTRYGPATNPEAYGSFVRISTQFDSIGTLLKNKLTDLAFMPRGIAIMVTSFWDRYRPIAAELEKQWGNTNVFGEIEYLYGEIKKRKVSVSKAS